MGKILLLFLLFALTGCAQPVAKHSADMPLTPSQSWSVETLGKAGRVSLSLMPDADSTTRLTLNHDHDWGEKPLVLGVSDRNCDTGFEVEFSYATTKHDVRYARTESPVPWDSVINISLDWLDTGEFELIVNGEIFRGEMFDLPETAELESVAGRAKLVSVHYQPLNQD